MGMRMQLRFAFGQHGLDITLPDGPRYEVIESRSASALPDARAALDLALDDPIGGKPLLRSRRARKPPPSRSATSPVPRPTGSPCRRCFGGCTQAGIPVEGVTILIATGLHREATEDEINAILGDRNRGQLSRRQPRCAYWTSIVAGEDTRGTPVYIDERFMAADLHITLGFIEQHLMLGFSGGRKLVAPGLAAQETIKVIHSPMFMREPMATEGSIDDNPLHAELLEIARMAGHDFMLDVTLTQTARSQAFLPAIPWRHTLPGSGSCAHVAGELSGPADAVITSAAGYPLDLTFYQTIKGITAAQHIVKPGGRILILGECAEGVGSPEFAGKAASFSGYDSFLEEIGRAEVVIDQWQLEKLALVGLRQELFFYVPGVAKEKLGVLASRYFSHWKEPLPRCLRELPAAARVALVPEGPYVYARVEEAQKVMV